MPVTSIDFTDGTLWPPDRQHRDVRVWTKTVWNAPFVETRDLLVQEAVWSIAPSFNRASLQYRYGPNVMMPGDTGYRNIPQLTTRGYYVLIKFTTDDLNPLYWLGYADNPVVVQRFSQGDGVGESGVQEIPCWGFDRALQYARIQTTVHENPDSGSSDKWLRAKTGSVFNDGIKGNRTQDKVELYDYDGDTIEGHVFVNPSNEEREWWSTQDIYEHLVKLNLPTSDFAPGDLPWKTGVFTMLPDWDRPRLESHAKNAHELLSELLSPDRLLGWRVDIDITPETPFDPPVVTAIRILPFTRTETDVTLPSIGDLSENPNQFSLVAVSDDLTDGQLQLDDSDAVDQVIVTGPREIAVGTFRYSTEFQKGWSASEESEYDVAYSTQPGWGALDDHLKKEWNQFFRDRSKYDDVYRHFPIDDDWDGTCEGDTLFYDDGSSTTYVPYLGNAYFLDDIPLFRNVDYEGVAEDVDETKGRFVMPILAFFEKPDSPGRYIAVQNANTLYGGPPVKRPNSLPYGVSVSANNERGPAFQIAVSGAPRHAIDKNFTGNNGDVENANPKIWGSYDYTQMLITAALVADRRPAFSIPATVSGVDVVRRRVIELEHPGLQMVNLATATVVGIDQNGDPLHSDGGLLRDPRSQIQALCTLAAKTLVDPRRQLSVRSARIIGALRPGYMITSYNGETANVLIRELRVSAPTIEDDSPPPITMHIEASTNEIDIVGLIGRVPEPERFRQ